MVEESARLSPITLSVGTTVDTTHLSGLSEREALEWLNSEESRTFSYLLAVRTLRNSVLRIHRLPSEILADIFLAANPALSAIGDTSWVTLTHVCRLWREVALQHAALWRSIDCENLDRAKVFYQRSKNLMVDIQLTSNPRNHAKLFPEQHIIEFVDFLREASNRISSLKVVLRPMNTAYFLDLLTFPIPKIKSFYIYMNLAPGDSSYQSLTPLTVLQTQQSVLEELFLAYVSIPWRLSVFRNLRSLTLQLQHTVPNSIIPTMDEFLNFLDAFAVRLETLELVETSGPSMAGSVVHDPVPTRTISLPLLKKFSMAMTAEPGDILYLLVHLILPETVQISLSTVLTEKEHGLHSILPKPCTGLKSLDTVDELVFDSNLPDRRLMIKGRVSSQPSGSPNRLSITLDWDGDYDEEEFMTMVANSFKYLKEVFTPGVTNFTFDGDFGDSDIETMFWVEFLGHFSNIEILNLSTLYTFSAYFPAPTWAALQPGESEDHVTDQSTDLPSDSPLLCPNLHQLSIKSSGGHSPVGSKRDGRTWDWELYECLLARHQHSIPSRLEKLIFVGDGPEWNKESLLQDAETNWSAISELVNEFEVINTELPADVVEPDVYVGVGIGG